jgi:hypothetical protein
VKSITIVLALRLMAILVFAEALCAGAATLTRFVVLDFVYKRPNVQGVLHVVADLPWEELMAVLFALALFCCSRRVASAVIGCIR